MNLVGSVFTIDFAGPRPGSFRIASSEPVPSLDTFYVGDERCALVRVAVDDLLATDPLATSRRYPLVVFHGPSGVGKSLLARGLTGSLQGAPRDASRSPLAYTGGAFSRACGLAIETNSLPEFRGKFEHGRPLIIDDLQAIANKQRTQEELLYAFDRCFTRRAPVVVTMPNSPRQTDGLIPSLLSRLLGGLDVPLQAPGPDGLLAIATRIAANQGASLPADLSAQLVAWGMGDTQPTRDTPLASIPHRPTMAQFARAAMRIVQLWLLRESDPLDSNRTQLDDWLADEVRSAEPELRAINTAVAHYFDHRPEDLRGPARRREIVRARSIAMYLARHLTTNSLGQVGKHFGNRDHTTVLHACRRIQCLLEHDDSVRRAVDELAARFTPRG